MTWSELIFQILLHEASLFGHQIDYVTLITKKARKLTKVELSEEKCILVSEGDFNWRVVNKI